MSVLLLRLAGPMQSWGTQSRFSHRDTGLEPSRCGVIGLLCAAIGRPREAPLDDFSLDKIKMAVRVDREGRLMRDYHTAQKVRRADTTKAPQETVLSERFYLADADFLVGLDGERALLESLDSKLRAPVWPLYLGRKSFVASLPVAHGIREGELSSVIRQIPWRKRMSWDECQPRLRVVEEVGRADGEPVPDVPLSFVSRDRRFAIRHVKIHFVDRPARILEPDQEEIPCF